jgi:hypoxanthine phosphoribosyltransferase
MARDVARSAEEPAGSAATRSHERPDRTDRPNRPLGPTFAHASEAEFARILDFYEVRWEYEPHTFPILWNLDGAVVESFSPDFYLPDFGTYFELTTLRQPLVRKKNRKLRRLRELYPDIRIKLFYARDFRALMLKYGKLGLVNALSGTLGQVTAMPAASPTFEAGSGADSPELDTGLDADEVEDAAPAALPTRPVNARPRPVRRADRPVVSTGRE